MNLVYFLLRLPTGREPGYVAPGSVAPGGIAADQDVIDRYGADDDDEDEP